jgi:endonuclease YncB( thermonuclease family)
MASLSLSQTGAVRGTRAVSACLALALIVHAQDTPPPLPPDDLDQTPAYTVVHVDPQCRVTIRLEDGQCPLILAGVKIPGDEPNRARLQRFLEQLLMGEEVCVRPESVVQQPRAPADAPEVRLLRAPDGLSVNVEAVRQGYAKVRAQPPCEHLELLRHYEQRARTAKKGIWAPSTCKSQPVATSRPRTTVGQSSPQNGEITVYVTKTGKKYHRKGCQHLRKSSRAITLKEAVEKGYEPCSRCKPPTRESPRPRPLMHRVASGLAP